MYIKLLIAIIIRTASDLSFKAAVHRLNFSSFSAVVPSIMKAIVNPFLWLGLSLGICNMLMWMLILESFDLSYAYPFLSICYISIILGGKFIFKEHLDKYKVIGILFISAGAMVLFLG